MNEFIEVLKKYAVFTGRAGRKEFWTFTLINIVIMLLLGAIDNAAGLMRNGSGILSGLYSLAVLVPSLAVTFRRLHDTNRSGWNILWNLLPFIGTIILIVFLALEGQPADNQYGPSPKAAAKVPPPPAPQPPAPPAA